ncbi:MAG TPA: hypothetical protein VK787_07050 [Puia sp.]|jgi:hypothetical protein|nr:hypothetical protein [Puia sp.]
MEKNYSIDPEAWLKIQTGMEKNKNWLTYDGNALINKENIALFEKKSQAIDFAALCQVYKKDCFLFHANSIDDVYRHLSKIQQEHSISLTLNNTIMNEQNLEYLERNLKYLGFGDKLNDQLKTQLQQGLPEFTLSTESAFSDNKMKAELYFRKPENSEMYFFNRYAASVTNEREQTFREQTFYLNHRASDITFKEAFNLLEGRSVHKEMMNKGGQKYHAWLQLDFDNLDKRGNNELKIYHQNYGFDLEKTLAKYPIKDLQNEESKKMLLASLYKGNLAGIMVDHFGKGEKVFISANPQMKAINFYDSEMKKIFQKEMKMEIKQDLKQELKKELTSELKPENKNNSKKLTKDDDLEKKPDKKKSRERQMNR